MLYIGNSVPNISQRVEYLLESISSPGNALQAAMVNIHADTNGLCSDFEAASSHIIEVDPYTCYYNPSNKNIQSNVSYVNFAVRGKTDVDLRWHNRQNICELYDAHKD